MIGATIGSTKRKRPNRKNRRKKQSGQGFSVSARPAIRRTGIAMGALVCMGLLMTALFFGYRWATTTSGLALTEIVVSGNSHLSYGDVLAAGRVNLGVNCLNLNVSAVQARLSKNPWVRSVAVRRELPGKLIIDIEERDAAFWSVNGDRLYYCDERGRLITAVTPGDFNSLPVLEAPAQLRGQLDKLPEVLRDLQARTLFASRPTLASIRVRETGEVECFLDRAGLTLQFSMADHLAQLQRLERVVADLRRRGELAATKKILAGPDRVWVEKKSNQTG